MRHSNYIPHGSYVPNFKEVTKVLIEKQIDTFNIRIMLRQININTNCIQNVRCKTAHALIHNRFIIIISCQYINSRTLILCFARNL